MKLPYKTFKKQADRTAQALGLVNVTTKRQEKNGTIIYHDPIASTKTQSVSYGIYSSGMVRRITVHNNGWGRTRDMYQLNRTRSTDGSSAGFVQRTERILANQMEQIGILSNRAIHFREYLVKL